MAELHPVDQFVKDHIEELRELADAMDLREGRVMALPVDGGYLIVNIGKASEAKSLNERAGAWL